MGSKNWIDRTIIEIRVKGSCYMDDPCDVSVSYLELLGGRKTAPNYMNKYHALREAIRKVANQLGANVVRDNPDAHEFYFTLLSSTVRKIEAEVNKKKDEIIASVINEGTPKALINDLYGVQVRTVHS